MALAAVSRLVVVARYSFLDALFAPAGQDRRAMEHRPQDRGHRRRMVDWQLADSGALEARRSDIFSNLISNLQACNSKLKRSLDSASGRCELREAPGFDLDFASILVGVACVQEAARPDPDPR